MFINVLIIRLLIMDGAIILMMQRVYVVHSSQRDPVTN